MKTISTLISLFFMIQLQAQVGGSWYGRADVLLQGSHNNYLAELILKQNGRDVSGIMGYYFKNSYQSFYVRGVYNARTRMVEFKNVPIMYFRSSSSKPSVDCIMNFEAQLTTSRLKSSLKGYFIRDERYRYTCPDLSINFTKDIYENTDSVLKAGISAQRIWRPMEEDVVVTPTVIEEKKLEVKAQPPSELQVAFEKRKPLTVKEIIVDSDSLRLSLYDNGDIDGDTISVFFNKVPILTHQGLSAQGINIYVGLDPNVELHELSIFAESLGSIPPNTALIIIHDGVNRHELFSTSDFSLNGTVYIRRRR